MKTKTLLLALLIALPGSALARKDRQPGLELVIQVVDNDSQAPIPHAKVRNPQEKDIRSVNSDTGEWRGRVLYLPDGTEIFFERGMELVFEISAPKYQLQRVTYTMRKRRNRIVVPLVPLVLDTDEIEDDEPVIQFGRDRPIGGRPVD